MPRFHVFSKLMAVPETRYCFDDAEKIAKEEALKLFKSKKYKGSGEKVEIIGSVREPTLKFFTIEYIYTKDGKKYIIERAKPVK
jgi:hypothetical protein